MQNIFSKPIKYHIVDAYDIERLKGKHMNRINSTELSKMKLSELDELIENTDIPTLEQKRAAWKRMDTGIYDEHGNLIGDRCADEDAYASEN